MAKIDTQSRLRHAGTTPLAGSNPRVGFSPTRLLNEAGTRPDPAVSVPSANTASPAATATAEPEDDPPEIYRSSNTQRGAPWGERVPFSPVANWSRLVLPIGTAPAARSRATTVASRPGA